jgi:hypothetical protein
VVGDAKLKSSRRKHHELMWTRSRKIQSKLTRQYENYTRSLLFDHTLFFQDNTNPDSVKTGYKAMFIDEMHTSFTIVNKKKFPATFTRVGCTRQYHMIPNFKWYHFSKFKSKSLEKMRNIYECSKDVFLRLITFSVRIWNTHRATEKTDLTWTVSQKYKNTKTLVRHQFVFFFSSGVFRISFRDL